MSTSDKTCKTCNHHKYVHEKGFGKCKVEDCTCTVLITWLPEPEQKIKGPMDAYF